MGGTCCVRKPDLGLRDCSFRVASSADWSSIYAFGCSGRRDGGWASVASIALSSYPARNAIEQAYNVIFI